jgi:hypothetical protein
MTIKIILAIVIIAAVIDSGVFISDYFNKSFAADALNAQIVSENQNVAQLLEKTKELNSDIVKNSAEVDNVTSIIHNSNKKLPDKEISANDVVRSLLQLGQNNNVSIIPLTTQDWTRVTTLDYDYRVLKLSLEVVGTNENIVHTIQQLPGLYNTLVVENIELSKPVPDTNDQVTPAPVNDQITGKITLAIYAK